MLKIERIIDIEQLCAYTVDKCQVFSNKGTFVVLLLCAYTVANA